MYVYIIYIYIYMYIIYIYILIIYNIIHNNIYIKRLDTFQFGYIRTFWARTIRQEKFIKSFELYQLIKY